MPLVQYLFTRLFAICLVPDQIQAVAAAASSPADPEHLRQQTILHQWCPAAPSVPALIHADVHSGPGTWITQCQGPRTS